jgi:hypothetical protein
VLSELERASFQDLDETMQERIRTYSIRAITILADSDSELKFEIFKRLNTGAVPLNDMELRNCVFYGSYMNLIKELADDTDFKQLVGFKGLDTRMRDSRAALVSNSSKNCSTLIQPALSVVNAFSRLMTLLSIILSSIGVVDRPFQRTLD